MRKLLIYVLLIIIILSTTGTANVYNITDKGVETHLAETKPSFSNLDIDFSDYFTIPPGNHAMAADINFLSNTLITGSQATLTGTHTITLNGATNISIEGVTFGGISWVIKNNSSNIIFRDCTFKNTPRNAVEIVNSSKISFNNCVFTDIGLSISTPTSQGCGIYTSNVDTLNINNCEFMHTYGHGALFLMGTTNILVQDNKIHDTFYRGIELWKYPSTGIIEDNDIYNCGAINTTKSGVGCNGIYAYGDQSKVDVINNTISNVFENGIEGKFGLVRRNKIDGTEIDPAGHPTPSTEGIWLSGDDCCDNEISNTKGSGIKKYSVDKIADKLIKGNKITPGDVNMPAIDLNSETGYQNIKVINNVCYGNKFLLSLRNKLKQDCDIENNVILK